MAEGPKRWTVERWARQGRQVSFLTVSRWSPVTSSIPGNEREREREKDREREVALATGELDKENVIVSYIGNPWQYLLLLH